MFTTMCPKEQQTSDNLIVKDNCFIIEIFDKGDVRSIHYFDNFSIAEKCCHVTKFKNWPL